MDQLDVFGSQSVLGGAVTIRSFLVGAYDHPEQMMPTERNGNN